MSVLFNMLSRFAITFLLRSKHLLISWLQSPSAVILVPKKTKSVTVSILFTIYLPWSDGTGCHDFHFWLLSFKPDFSLCSFSVIKRLFSSSSLSAIRVVPSAYLRFLIFIGRIIAEAPILWPCDVKSWLIGKDPDAWKDWRQKEKRAAEDKIIR